MVFLQQRLKQRQIPSFRQLALRSQVTPWQVGQLRQGQVHQMRLEPLLRIAQTLDLSLGELLAAAGLADRAPNTTLNPSLNPSPEPSPEPSLDSLRRECDRLQQQLQRQEQDLRQQFQRQSLGQLESWLKNWPKVVYAVENTKPELLAAKVLPLLHPLEELLASWGVATIGSVGEVVAYEPRQHQMLRSGDAVGVAGDAGNGSIAGNGNIAGNLVQIQRPGYRHGSDLLHRAEVKPWQP
ncbi:hypothetical protein PROH_16175 [Prochlorothrix hollandica PCC 9006 = CALU 1027]|uniref:HTH cro/C1-type domain-containing protein n=1 Tax=Prochlorothrix hollandica PCC 9006 = CALU 1027 TaxID=317619 RepID=A0A0M2PYE9_PROHO|nr:hypothetical protein PROH_16175 [Prochlorothrix hollandica PCC 9006 = CALU 1027]